MIQCRLQVNRIPEHDGIRDEPQGPELIFLTFTIRFTDFPSLTVADGAGHLVPPFTPVKLGQDATPVVLVIDIGLDPEFLSWAAIWFRNPSYLV